MCGIAGYWYYNRQINSTGKILKMSSEIVHRGPDDEGYVLIDNRRGQIRDLSGNRSHPEIISTREPIHSGAIAFSHQVAMAHSRFSIIDITHTGHQPMWNRQKSVCLVFNGEIFNHIELRRELEQHGVVFRTRSDTEVILEAYQLWGEECFERFSGFWALSLFDLNQKLLILCRDRIGKKPLYVFHCRDCILWASEIKALLPVLKESELQLNDEVIYNYLKSGIRDFGHATFWKDIRMMDNAALLKVNPDGRFTFRRYWALPEIRKDEDDVDFNYSAKHFRHLMEVALTERLRADVPVAFELSGGLDSSSLVALRATMSQAPFAAFSIKYRDKSVDESDFALKMVEHYQQIDHHLINFEEENLWPLLNDFIYLLEEPFHGPVLLIGQLLRKKMREQGYKVIIGGAGGDEVFAGYTEYAIPTLRALLKKGRYGDFLKNILFYKEKYPLSFFPLIRLLTRKIFGFRGGGPHVDRYIERERTFRQFLQYPKDINQLYIQNMNDLKMYYWMSSNDKSDMGIPIEVRNPFLDYRVLDFVFSLPSGYFFHNGWLKWFLRKSFQDIVPDSIVWRKRKRGFPFPLGKWLDDNKNTIFGIIDQSELFWLKNEIILKDYSLLIRKNPEFLWRAVNLQLWYLRFMKGVELNAGECGA
jgi:asparagine synthase (glutamine-hydrolysing)